VVRRWLVLLCGALLLAGCDGDAVEPAPFTPSPSATVGSPTASPVKAAWEKRTRAGAEAFAKHWIEVFNTSMVSGETEDLRAISLKSCETCSNFARVTEEQYAGGGSVESTGWRVKQAVGHGDGLKSGGPYLVALNIRQPKELFKNPAPEKDELTLAHNTTYSASLRWQSGHWRMDRLDIVR
jgi:hypothetical protein